MFQQFQSFHCFSVIKVTLIGSNENVNKCWKAVQHHASGCVKTEECDEFPLDTWDQETIDIFYKYCFEQHVIPEVNSTDDKFKLAGPKDTVMEMTKEFYRMKSRKAEEALSATYARIAVWLYETSDGIIEKYSLKLNAQIEQAYSNHLDSVSIVKVSFSA